MVTVNELIADIKSYDSWDKLQEKNMYTYAYYEPQDDITINELAQIVKLLFMCGRGTSSFDAKINFYNSEAYDKFADMFQSILRHFRIEIMENSTQ